MANDSSMMKSIRERTQALCETFDLESFKAYLSKRGLEKLTLSIDDYVQSGWITPLLIGSKTRFHKGHFVILLRLSRVSQIQYDAGVMMNHDFEDIMLRRSLICDIETADMVDDAKRIEALISWLWSDDIHRFRVKDAVQTKAIIDLTLDQIDPEGFYETLRVDAQSYGDYPVVQDLIAMQAEIAALVGLATSTGSEIPNVQYIFDRFEFYRKVRAILEPLKSPYLVTPTRNMMVDERIEFLKTRNTLMIAGNYQGLVDHYNANLYLFEDDVQRHARLYACLGNIYGQLLDDNAKAAEAFRVALQYEPGNPEAFKNLSHHLREAKDWDALVDLLSNHWDAVDSPQSRGEMITECAKIEAFHRHNIDEAIGLYERCMNDGLHANAFDDIHKIISELMTESSDLSRLRLLTILTTHITNYPQSDKVVALQAKYDNSDDPVARSTSLLIDAGVEGFRGDQIKAVELVREAIIAYSENTLIDGILRFVVAKMPNTSEFNDIMLELESEAFSTEDLAKIWVRIARALFSQPQHSAVAFQYAQHAVVINPNDDRAIELSYQASVDAGRHDRAFVYACLKARRSSNEAQRKLWDSTAKELRLSLNDDEKLLNSYESLLQYGGEFEGLDEALKELINSMSDGHAIDLLQRVEARCVANGMGKLVSELYASVLEREIELDLKRGLLERFIGFLLGQSQNIERDVFLRTHAQLFALAPSDRLFGMLQNITQDKTDELKQWTKYLHDHATQIDDPVILVRIYTTLADCYQNTLDDAENAADAYRKILQLEPDNVAIYKNAIANNVKLDRHFECVELSLNFPIEKLSPPDRTAYTQTALEQAFVYLYDQKAIAQLVTRLAKYAEPQILEIIDSVLNQAKVAKVANDQILGLLEHVEADVQGIGALALRIARAECLIQEARLDEAIALLDAETFKNLQKHSRAKDYIPRIVALHPSLEKSNQIKDFERIWIIDEPESEPIPVIPSIAPLPSAETNQAAVGIPPLPPPPSPVIPQSPAPTVNPDKLKKVLDKLEDQEALADLEADIKALPPQEASQVCAQIAAHAEQAGALTMAEAYYKRCFAYTQGVELLDFYKRNRQFKKALKILQFRLAKSPTPYAAISNKLDIAMCYQQINDVDNSLKWLNDVDSKAIQELEKAQQLSVIELKAALHTGLSDFDNALQLLQQASQLAEPKHREAIDVDRCLLMRETDNKTDAKKIWQTLILRGLKSDKMQLLNICFDIDAENHDEAENKIENLLASDIPDAIVISTLEQKLRLHTQRGDSADITQKTIVDILALDPNNAYAKGLKTKR